MYQHSTYSRPRREIERVCLKSFEEVTVKTSLTWKTKQSLKSRKYRVPYRVNPKRKASRHIVIKMKTIKDREC